MSSLSACADAEARFNEFVKRDEEARMQQGSPEAGTPDAGEYILPTPEQSRGTFLLAISTPLGPTKPVVNLLEVEAADVDGQLELQLRYRPLAAADRKTPVGEFGPWQPVVVMADGTYVAPTVSVTVPGSANPIDGNMIEAELSLQGRPTANVAEGETVDFLCGDVTGMVRAFGFPLPLTGSTFTATRIKDPDNYPPVTIDCAMTPAEPVP